VIRRLVPGETGPTGGPAFTDVIGTCVEWGEETVTIDSPRHGSVSIRIVEIVSGKPVPPPPPRRQRG
jgi:hypothetical protein